MTNILAIVRKDWRGYFASPIGYVVIGMYAIIFGYFYTVGLNWFIQQSLQAPAMGGGPMNVNQQMIRYVFLNSTVIFLFVVPLITMRTYAEEKRSGTIELLMTSPVTDFQIVIGKFLGAMSLYGAMLAITLVHIAILFRFGNPEWKPIASGYLGMLLLGGCFVSVGVFFSSLTKNQIVAALQRIEIQILDDAVVQQLLHAREAVPLSLRKLRPVGEDATGEIYLVDFTGGGIHQLVKDTKKDESAKFPRKLSETGIFASTKDHIVAPGIIPYEVNAQKSPPKSSCPVSRIRK